MVCEWKVRILFLLAPLSLGCASTPSLEDLSSAGNGDGQDQLPSPTPIEDQISTREIQLSSTARDSVPPISIVLVIDNSNSMLDKQQNLAAGMRSLLKSFESSPMDLKLAVYTTTADAQSDASMKSSALLLSQQTIKDANGNYILGVNSDGSYIQRSLWNLASPYSLFQIHSNDSVADVRATSTALTNSIRTIGINGSNTESPFCTIGRVLNEPSTGGNYVFQNGGRAAFLFISDSNDSSAQLPCLSERKQTMEVPTPMTSPQPRLVTVPSRTSAVQVDYSKSYTDTTRLVFSANYQVQRKCMQDRILRDCIVNPKPVFDPTLNGNPPASSASVACPLYLQNYLSLNFEAGNPITPGTCTYRSVNPVTTCSLSDRNRVSTDLCSASPIAIGQSTYSDFDTYCRITKNLSVGNYTSGICSSKSLGYPAAVPVGNPTDVYLKTALDSKASDLPSAIVSRANSVFGKNGYFFSGIFSDDQAASCASACEAYGDNLLSFISSLGTAGYHSSICGTDYSPALLKVRDFIQKIVQNSYAIALSPGESILSVSLDRGGVKISLGANDYSAGNGAIDFVPGVLRSGDTLRVTIRLAQP